MKRVLFVNDEADTLQGMTRWFQAMQNEYQVFLAQSGPEALRLLAKQPADVMIADARLPGMDGIVLLEAVQKAYPETVRIILSETGDKAAGLRSTKTAHQFLTKPIDPEQLKSVLARASQFSDFITNRDLQRIVSQTTSLPSLPALYFEILRELGSTNSSPDRVGKIISKDMGMSAKILQLVNSAFFGLPRQVSDPTQAVIMLGLETISDLVLVSNVFSQFDLLKMAKLGLSSQWDHSLRVGSNAREILRSIRRDRKMAEQAFLAGTLHDVGKLILAENLPEAYLCVQNLVTSEHIPLYKAEQEIFGANHAQIGGYLFSLWNLPAEIVDAVTYHQTPGEAPGDDPLVVLAVHVANSCEHLLSTSEKYVKEQVDVEYINRLGMGERVKEWVEMCMV